MPITTRRWDDPPLQHEGRRILVTRYRPRGLAKADETWDAWLPDLAPSKELHAAAYAKVGSGISWETYKLRYLREMECQSGEIAKVASEVSAGSSVVLLCSSQCERESRCHRSLLKTLIEAAASVNV